jgi:hypothetical protein
VAIPSLFLTTIANKIKPEHLEPKDATPPSWHDACSCFGGLACNSPTHDLIAFKE